MDTQKTTAQLDDLLAATWADFQVYLDRLHRVREIEDVPSHLDRRHRQKEIPPKRIPIELFRKESDSYVANRAPVSDQNKAEGTLSPREQVLNAIFQMTRAADNMDVTTGATTEKPDKPQPRFGLNLVSLLSKMRDGRRQQKSTTETKMRASLILELEIECLCREQATTIAREVGRVLKRAPIQRNLAEWLQAKGVTIVGSQVGVEGN